MATPSSSGNNNDDDGSHNDNSFSWRTATNWTIAGGSLDASITFESSDSPIESETLDAEGKSRLVLKPPSPDCGPCEIKINFTRKHEVRQVYVRSTARVYEIYFAPSLQSSNEYLCTVRCGVASRDDEVLNVTDAEKPADAHSKGSTGELAREKCGDDGNSSPNSDDWIEVKVPDSPSQDNQQKTMSDKINANPEIRFQDFYEATAEITDADACISLTIRLLSLQSKGCLYVDEIYVFADPVESADSETQPSQVANSTGSSLMAMLVPTLLQMSRTGNTQRQIKHDTDTSEKGEYVEVESRATDSNNIGHQIQPEESIAAEQDVKLQEVNEATPNPPQFHLRSEVADRETRPLFVAKPDIPCDRIERVLDQLVSRVSRIEDICLRFEENMLKPISRMEARLQRVEEQVEMLTKNSQLQPCTRISAPAFSCNGSNSSSFYNESNDYPACGALELEKKDTASDNLSNPPDDMSVSVNDTRFLPGLVVTAPEFSSGDEEENNGAVELQEDCPLEKQKQALSIDDALAAALAGFLCTTSVQPSHDSQPHTFQAPEFTIEENGDDGKIVSPSAQSDKPIVPTIFSCKSNGTEDLNDSVSNSSCTSSILVMKPKMGDFDDDCFKEKSEGVVVLDKMDGGSTSHSSVRTSDECPTTRVEFDFGQTDDCRIAESTSVSERTDILENNFGSKTIDVVEESEKDTLQDFLNSSSASESCVVDFELPILDVKFDSWESSSAYSPLEALLTDVPEFNVETPFFQMDDDVIGDQNGLILVEGGEPNSPLSGHHLVLDRGSCDAGGVPSCLEGEEAPPYSNTSDKQETFGSLI